MGRGMRLLTEEEQAAIDNAHRRLEDEVGPYSAISLGDNLTLDGEFTIQDLEAAISILREYRKAFGLKEEE